MMNLIEIVIMQIQFINYQLKNFLKNKDKSILQPKTLDSSVKILQNIYEYIQKDHKATLKYDDKKNNNININFSTINTEFLDKKNKIIEVLEKEGKNITICNIEKYDPDTHYSDDYLMDDLNEIIFFPLRTFIYNMWYEIQKEEYIQL